MKNKEALHKILDNDYAVRSGVYAVVEPSIRMEMDERGEYQYVLPDQLDDDAYERLLRVDMMSDVSANESELADGLFGKTTNIQHDTELGYYTGLYAGHVALGGFRERGSSGGMCSWMLSELLEQKIVDGVIHLHAVDPKKRDGKLFEYTISRSQEDINRGAKSRYYPGELSAVLAEVKQTPGKYAVVGIPEFITELRLLAEQDSVIKARITVMIGLVCGHQKTAKYAESLAWQQSIRPGDLESVDFRVKQPGSTAMDYLHEFTGIVRGERKTVRKTHAQLFGETWAYGFFKSKFSDFSDNVFNEVADVVFGDAWLPQYNKDGMGSNIVIVRDAAINNMIKKGMKDGRLKLDTVSATTVKQSQRGLIHHGRDELGYRLTKAKKTSRWVPKKRFSSSNMSLIRKHVQDIRYDMARKSHDVYQGALERDDWEYFKSNMVPGIQKYRQLYGMQGGKLVQNRTKSITADVEYLIDLARMRVQLRTRWHKLQSRARIRTRLQNFVHTWRDRREQKQRDSIVAHPTGAILTLTGYFNYGNILQRYALQSFLFKKGHRFISYAQEPMDTSGPAFDRLRRTIPFVETRIARKKYDQNDQYGAYIVGSDQVWRKWGAMDGEDIYASLRYYFFDFVKSKTAKRIAYAASFGQDDIKKARLTEDFMKSVKPLVKKMDAVSMREEHGVEMAKRWWGVDAALTVDPTMLLDAKDYSRLIEICPQKLAPSKQVYAYILTLQSERKDDLKKIFEAHGKKTRSALYLQEAKNLPPVEQWLQNIRDAELVVTDSFHGMVFSIINRTPFIVLVNAVGGSSRIESLLGTLGLEDRILRDADIRNYTATDMKPIKWNAVSKKLELLRGESGAWLLGALRGK